MRRSKGNESLSRVETIKKIYTRHYLDFDRGCALAGVDLDQPFDVDALKRVT